MYILIIKFLIKTLLILIKNKLNIKFYYFILKLIHIKILLLYYFIIIFIQV